MSGLTLLYCGDETPFPVLRPVVAGQIARTVARSGPVSACALIGGSGSFVIEASADQWQTVGWSAPVTATAAGVIVAVPPAALPSGPTLWRLRATGPGQAGHLYPGILGTVTGPSAPSALETRIIAVDTDGTGGLTVSAIKGQQLAGPLNWEAVPDGEIEAVWRAWHRTSLGGRLPWVVADPVSGALSIVRSACVEFPFQRQARWWWSGGFDVRGLIA